jgi:hypothetical protein
MADVPIKKDPYTEELFQKIKDENITVDPVVWSLMTHVLGNRVYSITLILGDYLSTPKWILNTGSAIMKVLYKISGNKGKLYAIDESLQRALNNTYMIKDFLKRLREITEKKAGF